jgi:hypothetical protein
MGWESHNCLLLNPGLSSCSPTSTQKCEFHQNKFTRCLLIPRKLVMFLHRMLFFWVVTACGLASTISAFRRNILADMNPCNVR